MRRTDRSCVRWDENTCDAKAARDSRLNVQNVQTELTDSQAAGGRALHT